MKKEKAQILTIDADCAGGQTNYGADITAEDLSLPNIPKESPSLNRFTFIDGFNKQHGGF